MTRRWTSRSVGSEAQHRIFYRLIRIGGRRAGYVLLFWVVLYYTLFRPDLRARGAPYLRRRFPGRRGAGVLADSFRLNWNLGTALVDRAVLGIRGPSAMRVIFPEGDRLVPLARAGKGLVILTAHVGSWQVSMSALRFLGLPVNMVQIREEGDVDRHWYVHAGERAPFRTIDPQGAFGGAIEMLEVLKRGEVLCLMGDRTLGGGKGQAEARFLGSAASFPLAAYRIAASAGSPIAVLLSHKSGPAEYHIECPLVLPPTAAAGASDRGSEMAQLERFVQVLEEFVHRHPYQFFNFFDMWSGDRADAPQTVS